MPNSVSSPPQIYRKLTRMRRGVGLMTQLWLGEDHLLHVTSTGYTENYRRCYLRDIQTMLIVHTAGRTYVALTIFVLAAIPAIILTANDSGPMGYGIVVAVALPFFIWNYLLGEGCRVVVVTAVQQEKVPSLSRLPKTRRVLAELKVLIEAAQVELVQEPVGVMAEGEVSAEVVPVLARSGPSLPPPLPPS